MVKAKIHNSNVTKDFQIEEEIEIQNKMNHENVLQLHEVIHQEDTNKMYLVMDFVDLGPIGTRKFWKVRNKKNKLPPENRLMPTKDVKHYFS